MTIAITPIPAQIAFVAPSLTLTTANATGSAPSAIRSDADVLAYDATVPDSIVYSQSAATGSAATAARRDHAHGMAAEPSVERELWYWVERVGLTATLHAAEQGYPVATLGSASAEGEAFMAGIIPTDMSNIVSFAAYYFPNQTGNMVYDIDCMFALDGELVTTNADTQAATTVAVVTNTFGSASIMDALTGITAGDLFRVIWTRAGNNASDTIIGLNFLGLRLVYN